MINEDEIIQQKIIIDDTEYLVLTIDGQGFDAKYSRLYLRSVKRYKLLAILDSHPNIVIHLLYSYSIVKQNGVMQLPSFMTSGSDDPEYDPEYMSSAYIDVIEDCTTKASRIIKITNLDESN